jgi:hypothetical protein
VSSELQLPLLKQRDEDQDDGPDPSEKQIDKDKEGKSTHNFAGFFEKLALILITFFLTTGVGGYLADRFRKENAKTEVQIAAMQADIGRSIQTFEAISQLMDKRLYRMRRLHDVFIKDNIDIAQSEQRLSDYRVALIEWNDNLNRFRALSAFYFASPKNPELAESSTIIRGSQDLIAHDPGDNAIESETEIDDSPWEPCEGNFDSISAGFAKTHYELQKLIDQRKDGSITKVQRRLDNLNVCVFSFDELMLSRISELRSEYQHKISDH